MARRIGDLLAERVAGGFVGRERELSGLVRCLEPGGPVVVLVHGIAGIGKSSLLGAFASRARQQGATVVRLDCRV
ncbi:MAG: ATP-binding protein, partial [Chloroflexota bacterium]